LGNSSWKQQIAAAEIIHTSLTMIILDESNGIMYSQKSKEGDFNESIID